MGKVVYTNWSMVPGEISNSDLARIYEKHLDSVETEAATQVLVDVLLQVGGELILLRMAKAIVPGGAAVKSTQLLDNADDIPLDKLVYDAPKGLGVWDELPLLRNSYGAAEAAAGSFVSKRIAASNSVTEGVYKFVVDKEGKIWLAKVTEDIPHSALVPKGEGVRGAGYVAVKNGKANVNGRSGHYMAETPLLGEKARLYDKAIRQTFKDHGIEVLENHVGLGGRAMRLPQ